MNGQKYYGISIQYSAIKKNGLLIHASLWMNLKIIIPCKKSQTVEYTYRIALFIYNFRKRKPIYHDRKQMSKMDDMERWMSRGGRERLQRTTNKFLEEWKYSLAGFGSCFTSVCIRQNLLYALNVYIFCISIIPQ